MPHWYNLNDEIGGRPCRHAWLVYFSTISSTSKAAGLEKALLRPADRMIALCKT